LPGVTLEAGRLIGLAPTADAVLATIDRDGGTHTVAAKLVVGADGTDSAVRKLIEVEVERVDYGQTAIVSVLALGRPHQGIAHERMTAAGPFALLPLAGDRAGVVWALPHAEAKSHLDLDDSAFLAAAQQVFGYRLGRFARVGRRQPWPLSRQMATRVFARRAVLVGNAAQTIHPVGAQGFNLGLRDAVALATRLAAVGGDPGDQDLLAAHARSRATDRERTIAWTESLLRGFARTGPVSRFGRSAALLGLDAQSALKRDLAFGLMGHLDDAGVTAMPRAAGT
jgi:2-octaprenyl-6-methoxyphenol hydroxylase